MEQNTKQRIREIERELAQMPHIRMYDEDGEINEDAYQERLEQRWYKEELLDEKKALEKILDTSNDEGLRFVSNDVGWVDQDEEYR